MITRRRTATNNVVSINTFVPMEQPSEDKTAKEAKELSRSKVFQWRAHAECTSEYCWYYGYFKLCNGTLREDR